MMDGLISRRLEIKVVRASCHWDYPWASKSPKDIMSDAVNALKGLPSAQPEIKPIDYRDCANAMMRMWMDNVLTDGEYNKIMDKLNRYETERRNDERMGNS